MSSRPGGGLQVLLDHAEREYQQSLWVQSAGRCGKDGGREVPVTSASHEAGEKTRERTRRGATPISAWTPRSWSRESNITAVGVVSDRQSEIRSSDAVPSSSGTPSRKRRRVPSSADDHGSKTSRVSRGAGGDNSNNFPEDGMRPNERSAEEAEADAEREESENLGEDASSSPRPVMCQFEGCKNVASKRGGRFCRRHGEGRRCKTPGCNKVDVGGGSCRRHGGGRRCGVKGCIKTDVGGGFCVSHGGGKRCQHKGCANGAQAGGVFCKSHGGGRRCRIGGCMTSAQSGADVLCIKHGGGKRCLVPGCQKLVRKNNRCAKHAASVPASEAAKMAKTAAAVAATSAVLTASTAAAAAAAASSPVVPPSVPRRDQAPLPLPLPKAQVIPFSSAILRTRQSSPEQRDDHAPGRRGNHAPPPPLGWSVNPGPLSVGQDQASPPAPDVHAVEKNGGGAGGGSVGGYAGSVPLPPVSALARVPPPALSSSTDPRLGPLPSHRPPIAAVFDGRAASGEPTSGGTVGRGPDGSTSNSDGVCSSGFQPRFLPRLPGLNSIGLPPMRLDKRIIPTEASSSIGQPGPGGESYEPPRISGAPNLRSLWGNLPRHSWPNKNAEVATWGGRIDISNDLLQGSQEYLVGGSSTPPQRAHPPPFLGAHLSQEILRSTSAVSSQQSVSSRDQQAPPSLLTSRSHSSSTATATATAAGVASSGIFAEGDDGKVKGLSRGVGDTPVKPCASNSGSSWTQGDLASTATPPAHPSAAGVVTPTSPAGKVVVDKPDEAKAGSRGSSSVAPGVAVQPDVQSGPAGAVDSMELIRPRPLAPAGQERSSCRGGQQRATALRDRAALAGESGPSKARSCSTSPPAEQTTSYISLAISGMMCMENCGQTVQLALQKVPGVRSVSVHFPTRTASVNVDPSKNVSVGDLTSALEAIGFGSTCIATTTTEEPTLEQEGVNAVWAIACALGLVDRGCAMAWGESCTCGDSCRCANCPQHMKKVSHAVDLVLKAVDLSSSADEPPPSEQSQQPQQQQQQQDIRA